MKWHRIRPGIYESEPKGFSICNYGPAVVRGEGDWTLLHNGKESYHQTLAQAKQAAEQKG